jgi:hypothetical protein
MTGAAVSAICNTTIDADASLRDLAKWYWHLHDDMEYPHAESADHLTDQQLLTILRQQFLNSDCGDFAIALHELTGWCLVNFFSPTQGRVHSGVLHPTGKIVDFDGFMTLAALRKRYGIADLVMGEANAQSVVGTSDYFDGEISGVDRAKATIKFLNHPPFNTIR